MEPVKKEFKHKSALSASRLDTLLECTAKYASKYLYKLPDSGNSGAWRGSTVHDIFEILANKRHEKIVKRCIKAKTCKGEIALWKLVNKYATKYSVGDPENLELIDSFLVTGLKTEFYGPEGTIDSFTEKEFDLEINEDDGLISFRIKGFIDRGFTIKENDSLYLECRDFKSSKHRFEEEKIKNNTQAIIYQIALSYLFPDIKLKTFKFIFLKFVNKPVQVFELYNEEQIYGYKVFLTEMQKRIDNFSEKDIPVNYAAIDLKLLMTRCGKEGFKVNGDPYFICNAQKPVEYYVIVNKENEIVKSAFKEADLKPKTETGEKVELRKYLGCTYFYKNGKKRNYESA